MKTVLVTGASGFIGRHALPLLAAKGDRVHAVARAEGPAVEGVQWHRGNLLAAGDVRKLMDRVRPTHLLHLAWYVEHGVFWNAPENVPWLTASLGLLEEFARCGGRRVVGAGTCAEYDWTQRGPFREQSSPLRPSTLYGAAKASLGWMQARMAERLGFDQAWCRLFFAYGPAEARGRLVPSLALKLLRGETADCRESNAVRDLMHVEDIAAALVTVLDSEFRGEANIVSGAPAALGEVARILGELAGRPELVSLGTAVDAVSVTGDGSILQSLGFSPARSLRAGLGETLEWWRAAEAGSH